MESEDLAARQDYAYRIIGAYLAITQNMRVLNLPVPPIPYEFNPAMIQFLGKGRQVFTLDDEYIGLDDFRCCLKRFGIQAELKDARTGNNGDFTRLLIDVNQPDFEQSLHRLEEATMTLSLERMNRIIRDGISTDVFSIAIGKEQAASFIASHIEQLLQIADHIGVSNLLDAILKRSGIKNQIG